MRAFRGPAVTLSGFRYGGNHTRADGPVAPWAPRASPVFDYRESLEGVSEPALSMQRPTLWVAMFASRARGAAVADVRFMPYLDVVSYDNGTGVTAIAPEAGVLQADFFTGSQVLIVTRNHAHVFEIADVRGNSATTLTLPAALELQAGDRLLLAPGPARDFRYLHSLMLDWSPTVARGYEWRNFLQSGSTTATYYGSVCGEFRSASWTSCSLRNAVAPLATRATLVVQAFQSGSSTGGAVMQLSHDSANHVIATVGLDRSAVPGSGTSSTLTIPIDTRQQTWGAVSSVGVVGRLTLVGWGEE